MQADKLILDFIYTDVTSGLTFFNGEEPLALANLRTKVVTESATVNTTITLDNSGNRITKMLDSVNVDVAAFVPQPTFVILNRRTQISGKVPLQGRTSSADLVTFMLRPVGSYESLPDSLFKLNDVDPDRFGVQVPTTDFDGKFTLVNVPSGIFILTAAAQRHLTGHDTIYVKPGLDITDLLPTRDGDGVQRTALLAGDAAGFEDSTGASLPDNAIGNPDVNAINAAIFSQPGDTNFDAFADINRDNIVNATDKDFATANQTDNTGTVGRIRPVFPVFKGAGPTTDNREAIVTLVDLPNREIRAGEAFDVTVQVSGARAVRTYEVHLGFDSTKVAVEGLSSHGSFLGNYLSDMVVRVFDGEVGLANSIIGLTPVGASGEGTLATIRFRALKRSTETHLKLNSAVLIDVDHVGVSPKVNGEATIIISKDPIVYHDAEGKEIRGLIIPEADPKVDFNDFMVLVEAFGSNVGSPAFDLRADLNADDRVDFSDFLIFTFDFGKIAVDAPASARPNKPATPTGVNGAARMSLKLEEGSKDGQLVRLTAGLSRARALQGWGLTLRYDPSRFEFLEAVRPEKDLLEVAGASASLLLVHQEAAGAVTLAGAISRGTAASGTGDLAVLIFRSRAASTRDAKFELYEGVLFDPDHLPNHAHVTQNLAVQQASIQQTRSGRSIRSLNLESGIFSSP